MKIDKSKYDLVLDSVSLQNDERCEVRSQLEVDWTVTKLELSMNADLENVGYQFDGESLFIYEQSEQTLRIYSRTPEGFSEK